MPATTTDLGRFPEKSDTHEITSFLAPKPASSSSTTAPSPTPAPVSSSEGREVALGIPVDVDPQIEIQERIGAGGMGEVFRGVQKHLGRKVAVKRIRDWGADAATKERFIHEAKAQSRLQHPGIAQVHDLREAQGALYLIMEYVEGRTLEAALAKDGKFTPDRIVSIGVQLTEALEAAAHEGYIHRDLKPGNVMLTAEGKIKIIDFGLALRFRNLMQTRFTERARFTEKGEVLGTPAYMSPEQLNQEESLDVRSDIWSLGVLLYTLATGEPPFTGRDFVCTVKNVMMSEPVPLPTLEEGFPPGLWQAIARALRKDRPERWQDYPSFRQALLAQTTNVSGEPISQQVPRRSGKRTAAFLLSMLFMVLGLVALARYGPFSTKVISQNGAPSSRREDPARHSQPVKKETGPEPTKDLALPPERPIPAVVEKSSESPVPAAVPLRAKLASYAMTEEESAFVREVLDLFSKHRPHLLAKSFGPIQDELAVLERDRLGLAPGAQPTSEKEYSAAQLRAASRMVSLAQGAVLARLEELRQSKEEVSLHLADQTTRTGVVAAVEHGVVTLTTAGSGQVRVTLESILPESLKGQAAPATATLALLALSGCVEGSFDHIVELSETREDLLFWVPLAVRLARLDLELAARAVATAKKDNPGLLPNARPIAAHAAQVGVLAGQLKDHKDGILRAFNYLGTEFSLIEREEQAFRFLVDDAYGKVLALGPGTAAFPVAAEILLARFETEVKAAHDELHAGTGWHGYGWSLFPMEKSLKEQQKYWDLDPEGMGSRLQASETERRIAMGKGAKRAPEGVLARIGYEPKEGSRPAAHWRLLLRSREGVPSYLRFDASTCALYRPRLESGAADVELARAPLPAKLKAADDRVLALMLIEGNLHVIVDGRHVLAVPEAEAAIPMQLSFAVTQGKLWIKSVKAKKFNQSPAEEEQDR